MGCTLTIKEHAALDIGSNQCFSLQIQSDVTYPNFSYPKMSAIRMHLAKPCPLFPATFVDVKLALAVLMTDIECFRARSTRCIEAEDTG